MSAKAVRRRVPIQGRKAEPAPAGWNSVRNLEQVLTLEVALYLVAAVLGGLLRFLLLDLRPLSAEEGTLALESYRIWLGQPPESLSQGPLLAYGNALALAMFAEGDGAARFVSALSGSALVALPYLLRASLGRVPALLAAFGLALSPLLVFASRDVTGGLVPVTLGLLLWWTLERGAKRLDARRAYGTGLLVAGLVTSGNKGITVLVTLALAALLSHPQPLLLLRESRAVAGSPLGRRSAAACAVALVVVGMNFGSHLPGIQWALVDVWTSWVGSFSLSAPRGSLLLLLAMYEFPVLLLGGIQMVRAIFRRERVDGFLAMWLMLVLLFTMVQTSGAISRLILPIVPLYLLATRLAAESLPLAKGARSDWKWFAAALAVAVPLGVGTVLLNRGSTPATSTPAPFLYLEIALVIVGALAVGLLLDGRGRAALAWFAVMLLCVGYTLHGTAFLNYRIESLSMEPVIGTQVAPDLRDAALAAAYYSAYHRIPVAVDPQLRVPLAWYLRGAREVEYSAQSTQGIAISLSQLPQVKLDPSVERIPGLFSPTVSSRDLTWQGAWRWAVGRDGLVRPNPRDIIVRAPAGNW